MSFKTELHCHSMPVSSCGRIAAEQLVETYLTAGFTTVVLTNHFSRHTFRTAVMAADATWEEKGSFFLSDFEKMKAAAGDRLHILMGMEFRLDYQEETDFLVYGLGEEFLLSNPDILQLKFKDFSVRVREAGGLLIQAHPFRNNVVISDPTFIDGVEVWNCSVGHASRNDVAEFWANRFSLIKTSGSDLHCDWQIIGGGMETDAPITTDGELLATLRGGKYTLLRGGVPNPN
ncbi:MAG: PHP domain-containing protein [Clostridia bacterium]|nr:PHP domain-containing protein [Clostridia bacterium]